MLVNGGLQRASRSLGNEAIAGMVGFTLLLLQRHSFMIILTNNFPRRIQNCWCTRASVCSLPKWKCLLWMSWANNLDRGCPGESSAWCLTSYGIGTLVSRPPTLIILSTKTGCRGSSELFDDKARFAALGRQHLKPLFHALEKGQSSLLYTLICIYISSNKRTADIDFSKMSTSPIVPCL